MWGLGLPDRKPDFVCSILNSVLMLVTSVRFICRALNNYSFAAHEVTVSMFVILRLNYY